MPTTETIQKRRELWLTLGAVAIIAIAWHVVHLSSAGNLILITPFMVLAWLGVVYWQQRWLRLPAWLLTGWCLLALLLFVAMAPISGQPQQPAPRSSPPTSQVGG